MCFWRVRCLSNVTPRSLTNSEACNIPSSVVKSGRGVVLLNCDEKWISSDLRWLRRSLLLVDQTLMSSRQSFSEKNFVSRLCYCVQMTLSLWWWVPPPPPLHPIIHKIKIKNNIFCDYNVQMSFESWGLNLNSHTMCMGIIYPKPKYRSFCNISFLTFPKIYATCTRILRFDRKLSKL